MPTLGLIQLAISTDLEKNFYRTERLIENLGTREVDIIALPEIFYAPFFPAYRDPQYWDWAIEIQSHRVKQFQALAKKVNSIIILPIFERVGPGIFYNTVLTLDPWENSITPYRKTHVPLNPIFFEKYYFKPGNLGYPVAATRHGRIGTPICHDRHYPEVSRAFALGGADLLIYPTAAHSNSPAPDVWEVELRAIAIANQLFVAAINRVGKEGDLRYFGKSLVVSPAGDIIDQANDTEQVLRVDLDYSLIEERRRQWHFFRDRRPETYHVLTAIKDGEINV